jgi:hypothetical protein
MTVEEVLCRRRKEEKEASNSGEQKEFMFKQTSFY